MKLNAIDWANITQAQARRLIGPANQREQTLAKVFNESGYPNDEALWMAAFTTWENLRVFAICGERPNKKN